MASSLSSLLPSSSVHRNAFMPKFGHASLIEVLGMKCSGLTCRLLSSLPHAWFLCFLPSSSLLRYGGNLSLQSAMSVRFNSNGTQLLALRRRLPPVLYDIHSRLPVFQFDNQGYFNSCTMKSCCFAGDRDQVSAFCLLHSRLLLSSQIVLSVLVFTSLYPLR